MHERGQMTIGEGERIRLVKKIRVVNDLGLHTRPATYIVKLLQSIKSEVFFTFKKETVSAKSILNILMLAVPKGALITITVIGEDAKRGMEELTAAFENQFGE